MLNQSERLALLPENTHSLLFAFVEASKNCFGENLTGVYLHGSAAMGCFHPETSDLDLIVVVKDTPDETAKLAFLNQVLKLDQDAPAKGIEMSVVLEEYCRNFIYPTPFVLHYSRMHHARCIADPTAFVQEMHGTDPDLAAHFMIIFHRGITLFGPPARELFKAPAAKEFRASIELDAEDAADNILKAPVYGILNLLRVLAYKRDNLLLSKKEAHDWALQNADFQDFKDLIEGIGTAYETGRPFHIEDGQKDALVNFSASLLRQIKDTVPVSRRSWLISPDGLAVNVEEHMVRVRADDILQNRFKEVRGSASALAEELRAFYKEQFGKELNIRKDSLAGEIRIHAWMDRVFLWWERFSEKIHLGFAARFFHRMHIHTWQVDCGERSVDGNRIIFDLLSPLARMCRW